MELKVKYTYTQQFLPSKRYRKAREVVLQDAEAITLKELSAQDFPVAFVVHDYQSVQEGMASYDEYDSEKCKYRDFAEQIRTYNGKLFAPERITHGAAISTLFQNEQFLIHHLEYWARDWKASCPPAHWNADALDDPDPGKRPILLSNNREEALHRLQEDADGYVLFRGNLWHEVGEPRYVINTFGLGHNHGGTGFFIEYYYNDNIPNSNYFNALQREEAIRYGKEVALRRGDTESVESIGKYDNIEVLMPECVKVNPAEQHGEGDPFMNSLEAMISRSGSVSEAGILCMTMTAAEINK